MGGLAIAQSNALRRSDDGSREAWIDRPLDGDVTPFGDGRHKGSSSVSASVAAEPTYLVSRRE
jgi:hypothetical protein